MDGYRDNGTLTLMLYKQYKHPGHPTSDMHPISAAHKENIISLASHGHSTHYIASPTGISQPTVSRVLKDILPNWQTPHFDHPSKL